MSRRSFDGGVRGRLLAHGTIYALATAAPVLVGLVVTPLVTRYLGANEYGVVGVGVSLYQTGAILLGAGLSAAITRHAIIATSGVSGAVALVYFGTGISAIGALVAWATLGMWGPVIASGDLLPTLSWPIASALGLSVLTLSQSVLRAQNRVKTFVVLGTGSAVTGPAIGLLAVVLVRPSASAYLVGLAAGHALTAAVSLALIPRCARKDFRRAELVASLKMGIPTVPHSIASALLVTLAVLLSARLDGMGAAGRMQLALFLGTSPLAVLAAFNNSWAPLIYRTSDKDRPALLARSSQVVSVLVFFLVATFCILVDPVARFIAGPAIYSSELTRLALIAATATPLMALYLVNINEVFLSGKTGLLSVTTPSSVALALATALSLRFGFGSSLAFAVTLPAFHLAMWLLSVGLRARTGAAAPLIRASLPGYGLAGAVPLVNAFMVVPLWMAVTAIAVLGGLLTLAARGALRELG